ncbi:hypothetical protein [Bradyrhizobium glycinis]|uniref:hypothetical protein n=1 Tax=Bradyrhizobium glycinis TaxID=2751812 RepID=UPI0018D79CF5|nr:hypothetical protein [Bradyrhizobium glycinis]MBH5371491.1 hypothetical protein [Bradyrhizobium glycinis]
MAMPNITTTIRTNSARYWLGPEQRAPFPHHPHPLHKKKAPRFRARLFWLTALGFQRLADSHCLNLKLKSQKATAPP